MKQEKIAAIGLAVIIIGALSVLLSIEYGDELLDNLTNKKDEDIKIEIGDCADINFTAYYTNGTVFATSYEEVAKENGIYNELLDYSHLKVFVNEKWNETAPEGFSEEYMVLPIPGLMEALEGKKEGVNYTIGPIPPEKAFGLALEKDVVIDADIPDEYAIYGIIDMDVKIIDIIENVSVDKVSDEYSYFLQGVNTTTLYVARDRSYAKGDTKTVYPSWQSSTEITKINDTYIWWETNPPEDKIDNFTWKEYSYYGDEINYWENASNAEIIGNSIIVTHTPKINQNFTYYSINYSVESFNETKINCSNIDSEGNVTYREFDRVLNLTYNQSQKIVYRYPKEYFEYLLPTYRLLDPTVNYAVGPTAGETVYFDIIIEKIYKTS